MPKKWLVSETTTEAVVYEVEADTEDEAVEKFDHIPADELVEVNRFNTDVFTQGEGLSSSICVVVDCTDEGTDYCDDVWRCLDHYNDSKVCEGCWKWFGSDENYETHLDTDKCFGGLN